MVERKRRVLKGGKVKAGPKRGVYPAQLKAYHEARKAASPPKPIKEKRQKAPDFVLLKDTKDQAKEYKECMERQRLARMEIKMCEDKKKLLKSLQGKVRRRKLPVPKVNPILQFAR